MTHRCPNCGSDNCSCHVFKDPFPTIKLSENDLLRNLITELEKKNSILNDVLLKEETGHNNAAILAEEMKNRAEKAESERDSALAQMDEWRNECDRWQFQANKALATAAAMQERLTMLANCCGCLEPDEYGRPSCNPPCVACESLTTVASIEDATEAFLCSVRNKVCEECAATGHDAIIEQPSKVRDAVYNAILAQRKREEKK